MGELAAPRGPAKAAPRNSDGVDPDDVILTPERAEELGVTSTVCFPRGNLAPQGSVIKSTAIDPRVVDADGVYRKTGPARVFCRETDAIAAIKGQGDRGRSSPATCWCSMGRGPLGSGMEEIFQITSALRYLSWGHEVAVVTDARFSGVSTGACIGLVGPEALAGGPIGKVRDGDRIRIVIDRKRLEGQRRPGGRRRAASSAPRKGPECSPPGTPHPDLSPDPQLPGRDAALGRPAAARAAAPGAAACSTSSGSWTSWPRDRRRSKRCDEPRVGSCGDPSLMDSPPSPIHE